MHTDLDLVRAIHADRLRTGQDRAEAPRGRPGRWRTLLERTGTVLQQRRVADIEPRAIAGTSTALVRGDELSTRRPISEHRHVVS